MENYYYDNRYGGVDFVLNNTAIRKDFTVTSSNQYECNDGIQ